MNRVQHLFLSLLALVAVAAPAAAQTWTAVGPQGGEFPRVFVNPSQPATLFAMPGGDAGGLFKSTNSGDSWLAITSNMSAGSCDIHVNDLAIHPTQPNTIYAATEALGVCKSTDGGTTWTQLISGLPNDANSYQRPVKSIAINPQTPTVIIAGTEAGIYTSTSSGNTWTLSGAANHSVQFIAFAPSAPNTAYGSANGGVFKTTDGGTTWVSVNGGLPSTVSEGQLTVSPTTPNTAFLVAEDNVYRTTNGGTSWAVSNSGATGAFFYGNISIDPVNPITMFLTAVGSCGLCKSTDGGATWTTVGATGLPTLFGIANLAETTTIDPATPSRMFAGTPNGVYRSTNNGATWVSAGSGLNGLSIGGMALGGDAPASLFVGTSSVTTDGSNILKLPGGALPFTNLAQVVSDGELTDLVIDPTNGSIVYAVGGRTSNGTCRQIYKSTNGGTSFTAINPSTVPSTLCAGSLVMDPTAPATLYLGVSSPTGGAQSAVVYKTTNGGTSWTSVSTGLSFSVQRIAISKRTPSILYAGSASTVYKTTNGGGTWINVNSGLPSLNNSSGGGRLAIDPTDDNLVYFGTNQGVYGTTNGGSSWTAKRGGWPTIHGVFFGATAVAIDPATPTTLYASPSTPHPGPGSFPGQSALGTGLYKSTDSGATWTVASNTLAGVNVSNILFDGPVIYAATNNGVFKFAVVTTPTVTLSRNTLNFAATNSGPALTWVTPAQDVGLTVGSGSGTVSWTATSDKPWLTVTPSSGSGTATVSVAVKFDATLPASGTITGNITLALTGAANTVGPVAATFVVAASTAPASLPFGSFDTPVGDASVLAGSIAVTGWTLDNIGVKLVELWRDVQPGETTPPGNSTPGDPRNGKIYIANGNFVDNARPDVEVLYPTTPANYRAGWGYLMLTWGLYGQGNGTYKFHAIGIDQEGGTLTIGTKTVVISNNTATKPFGSIDTPAIGGVASGPNFGWGLTPKVNGAATCRIPASGVQYSIDSGPLQPVVYGQARSDLAQAFPGFSNSAAAAAHALIDWSALTTGAHTIGWVITDDCNRADGVGSRFFHVTAGTSVIAAETSSATTASLLLAGKTGETESDAPITVARGYGELPEIVDPGMSGSRTVEMQQGDRIEIRVPRGFESAYQLGPSGQRRALPAGTTWDPASGTFYWQPAPGFLGRFRFVFGSGTERISVRVVVVPSEGVRR
jgi:hypothetical protein